VSWLLEIARPDIRALGPYEHALWAPGLVRLHANELPWRSGQDTSRAGLNRYPEPHPFELAAALARFYGVEPDRLLVGRGSDEAIDLLVRAYCRAGVDAVTVCPPTFGMYAVAARIQGAGVLSAPLRREAGYACDFDALLALCSPAVRLVFLCSPNNPTGNRLDGAAVVELVRALEGRCLVVVDEAYVEFAAAPSLLERSADLPGLVLLRTLSKAYALAGARCGALIAHPDVVTLLRKVIPPYALAQPSIEAALAALEPDAVQRSRAHAAVIRTERARLAAALGSLPRVRRVWPSEGNFLLVEFEDAQRALERSHAAGLLLRDLRAALAPAEAVRISVGSPEQNERLLACLA
jgi:histidinol-phosphate aminotransferase